MEAIPFGRHGGLGPRTARNVVNLGDQLQTRSGPCREKLSGPTLITIPHLSIELGLVDLAQSQLELELAGEVLANEHLGPAPYNVISPATALPTGVPGSGGNVD